MYTKHFITDVTALLFSTCPEIMTIVNRAQARAIYLRVRLIILFCPGVLMSYGIVAALRERVRTCAYAEFEGEPRSRRVCDGKKPLFRTTGRSLRVRVPWGFRVKNKKFTFYIVRLHSTSTRARVQGDFVRVRVRVFCYRFSR